MERIPIQPRENWVEEVEKLGLLFHTFEDKPYWNEAAYYQFTSREIEELEKATNELHERCIQAVQHVIDNDRFAELKIPAKAIPMIKWAWEAEPPSLYGRFDFVYDGYSPPKLLEYNADTPTALLEAAVIQWHWLQDRFDNADQFNSIWEGLVELWTELKTQRKIKGLAVHFAHAETLEDLMTVTTLRDTAEEAGLITQGIHMGDIGWNEKDRQFVDLEDMPMRTIFKLYPWEWLLQEEFAAHLLDTYTETQWIEPIWKAVLSNKGILAILWELYPNHPYLLPAYLDGPQNMTEYVKKPLLSREGANITIVAGGHHVTSDGDYGQEGFVYQGYAKLPDFNGNHPIIGSWVIDGGARGMGIRESDGPITDDFARFVPHIFA